MEVKIITKKLKESLDSDSILSILSLIGEAHDKIMEAQDELSNLKYDLDDDDIAEEEDTLGALEEVLDSLEADISDYDFMGEDDPVEAFKDKVI